MVWSDKIKVESKIKVECSGSAFHEYLIKVKSEKIRYGYKCCIIDNLEKCKMQVCKSGYNISFQDSLILFLPF